MSVAEIAPRGGEFERTPPHDVAAEQCVLGGMLLSKDAISDVIEVIRPRTTTGPPTRSSTRSSLDLYGRGEPADTDHRRRRADTGAARSAGSAARPTCTR